MDALGQLRVWLPQLATLLCEVFFTFFKQNVSGIEILFISAWTNDF